MSKDSVQATYTKSPRIIHLLLALGVHGHDPREQPLRTLPASHPPSAAHLVTCLWKSVSCLCVTWRAPPEVSFGKPFSEFSSQRQKV